MRKLIKILPIVFVLIICTSCNQAAKTPDITQSFTVTAEICYGDFEGSATINKVGHGVWNLEFTAPDTVNQMKVSYTNGDIQFSLDGISFDVSGKDSMVTTVPEIIFNAVDELSGNNETLTAEQNDTQIIVKFEKDDKKYILTFDKKSGALATLDVPKDEISITFADYKVNA